MFNHLLMSGNKTKLCRKLNGPNIMRCEGGLGGESSRRRGHLNGSVKAEDLSMDHLRAVLASFMSKSLENPSLLATTMEPRSLHIIIFRRVTTDGSLRVVKLLLFVKDSVIFFTKNLTQR